MTIAARMTGARISFTSEDHLLWVDRGICPLRRTLDGSLECEICEPLLVEAANHVLRKLGVSLYTTLCSSFDSAAATASSRGSVIDRAVALAVSQWKGRLDTIPLLEAYAKLFPDWMKGIALSSTQIDDQSDSSGVDDSFLGQLVAGGRTVLPSVHAGPDVARSLDVKCNAFLLAANALYADDVTAAKHAKNIKTASFSSLYTRGNGQEPRQPKRRSPHSKRARYDAVQTFVTAHKPHTLRLLVELPYRPGGNAAPQFTVDANHDVQLLIDMRNVGQLFDAALTNAIKQWSNSS